MMRAGRTSTPRNSSCQTWALTTTLEPQFLRFRFVNDLPYTATGCTFPCDKDQCAKFWKRQLAWGKKLLLVMLVYDAGDRL